MCPYGRDVTVGIGSAFTVPYDGMYSIDGGPAVRLAKGAVIGRGMAAKFSQMTRTQADMFNVGGVGGVALVFTEDAPPPAPSMTDLMVPPETIGDLDPPAPTHVEEPLEGPPDPPMPKYTIEVEGATAQECEALHAQVIALRAEADALRRQLATIRESGSAQPITLEKHNDEMLRYANRAISAELQRDYFYAETYRLRRLLTTHEKDMVAMQETHAAVRALARTVTGMGEKTATVGAVELKRALATVGM